MIHFFVAQTQNTNLVAGVSLCAPIFTLMIALGDIFGIGGSSVISRLFGQKQDEEGKNVSGFCFYGAIVCGILVSLIMMIARKPILTILGTNQATLPYASQYYTYMALGATLIIVSLTPSNLMRTEGLATESMIGTITGSIINMILDPILIYGLLGVPEMGVAGAAYATVIGQVVSFLVAIIFHVKFNKEIKGMMKNIKPSSKIIKEIYMIGLPAIIAQALMSFMTYGLNIILVRISETAVTAYGLYYKIQQFILFAAFGLRDAITPIVSFNHGMRSKERVKKGIKYGLIYTLIIMIAGTVVLEIFANPFSKVFGLSGETQQLCVSAIRVISISFVFAGANIAFQGIFQALEGGMESLLISICRQFLFVLPVAWGFSLIATKDISYIWLVWMTFPIAEALSCIIACVFMKKIDKKKIQSLKNK